MKMVQDHLSFFEMNLSYFVFPTVLSKILICGLEARDVHVCNDRASMHVVQVTEVCYRVVTQNCGPGLMSMNVKSGILARHIADMRGYSTAYIHWYKQVLGSSSEQRNVLYGISPVLLKPHTKRLKSAMLSIRYYRALQGKGKSEGQTEPVSVATIETASTPYT